MNIFNLIEVEVISFLLVLCRMSAFFIAWPLFGSMNVPAPVKILLSVMLSLVLTPVVTPAESFEVKTWQQIMFFSGKEVVIGLVLAFVSGLFFYTLTIAGDLVSLSMGISSAKLYNPSFSVAMTPIDRFYYFIGAILFLVLNLHHVFLTGLVHSYDILPIYQWGFGLEGMAQIVYFGQEILIIGLQLAAPILVSILLINITLAIIGRAVPQINVLITSLPMNILVGLVILLSCVPLLMSHTGDTLNQFAEVFVKFLKTV